VEKLAVLQARLLKSAVNMVRPGGLIVYCTCSLQPEEGESQIEALLATDAPVTVLSDLGMDTQSVTAMRLGDLRPESEPWLLQFRGQLNGDLWVEHAYAAFAVLTGIGPIWGAISTDMTELQGFTWSWLKRG